jgi:hypothetical protein
MHGNLELLLTTLHVILTLALAGLVPFIFRRLDALRRQQQYLITLVYRLMDNQRSNKASADISHRKLSRRKCADSFYE